MSEIQIESVEERDSSWEVARSRFRIYLHDSGQDVTHGSTATFDITGVDVLQVIDWAQRRAGNRSTYAVALVRDDSERGRGLVWLVGMDGNDRHVDGSRERAIQQRMLRRRVDPVVVPAADSMPDGNSEL